MPIEGFLAEYRQPGIGVHVARDVRKDLLADGSTTLLRQLVPAQTERRIGRSSIAVARSVAGDPERQSPPRSLSSRVPLLL